MPKKTVFKPVTWKGKKTIFFNPRGQIYQDMPNLAMGYAATLANVPVIDQNCCPTPVDRILDIKADRLAMSIRSMAYEEALRIAKEYKNKYPKAEIVSINAPVNVQCCYPFLHLKKTIDIPHKFDDSLPFPNYDLFDSIGELKANWQAGNWYYPVMTVHGCPYSCTYCAARKRGWEPRSARNIYEELKQAKRRWGITKFELLDDTFNVHKPRLLEFCRLVKRLKLNWIAANGLRADRLDDESAKAMAEAGCTHVSFGMESIHDDLLAQIQKGEKFSQIENAVKVAKKHFKGVNGFFILGLPGSTYKKDLESFKWVVRNKLSAIFSYYVPFDKKQDNHQVFYDFDNPESLKPTSNSYPKHLQEKIYKMSLYMRNDWKLTTAPKKIFTGLKVVWDYDRKHLPHHLINAAKRMAAKFVD